MSVDERLRSGLARNARSFEPDVEARLAQLRRRGRPERMRLRRVAAVAGAAAAAIVVSLLTVVLSTSSSRPHPPAPPGNQSDSSGQALVGTWTLTVRSSPVATSEHLAGTWTMSLGSDSTLRMRAPAGYRGVLSGALFSSTSSGSFRTSLFSQDLCSGSGPGSYRWVRSGGTLRLNVADDPCPARVLVLGSQAWHAGR